MGAGGTRGGEWQFFVGLTMMVIGFYLLLNSIHIYSQFGFGTRLYSFSAFGGFGVTSGMIMIPFVAGIVVLFYNHRNYLGWFLTVGSILALIFGVIASTQFSFRPMSAFDLIVILVLCFGGIGLFLKSLFPAKG